MVGAGRLADRNHIDKSRRIHRIGGDVVDRGNAARLLHEDRGTNHDQQTQDEGRAQGPDAIAAEARNREGHQ